jgi:predicted RNase H-like nuclease
VHARRRPGPELPYRPLAGVVPCRGGWLAVTGKLQGITLLPEGAQVLGTVIDVLDYRPSFDVIALHAPVGLLGSAEPGGRRCDREARRLLGPARGASVFSPPSRALLASPDGVPGERLSAVARHMLPHVAEVAREIGSYHQRTVFEVLPELTYYQLNEDRPLRWSKRLRAGQDERRALLEARMPGIDRVLDAGAPRVAAGRLLDAAAALWTARRIAARGVARIPEDPEWDEEGIRMEIVR